MAKGISEALLLTFEGVGLSVPSIYFFSFFRNRVMSISVTTMTRADEFLRHFAQAARGKSSGPAAAAAPAAAAKDNVGSDPRRSRSRLPGGTVRIPSGRRDLLNLVN